MIRNLKHFLIILTIVLLFSCTAKEESYTPPEMVTEITPSLEEDGYSEDIYDSAGFDTGSEKPLIRLDTDEVLISTINLNLDLDSQEEQVLVFKKRNNPEGKIHIAVADYDNVQNSYSRIWESETMAENIRSFIVYLDDLIGDHNSEIVCSGRDSEGRTTLDVFWKNAADRNQSGYLPVFNIAERGTIEINEMERARGYLQGLKNGISFTITVTSEAGEMELIISKYYWDFAAKQYVLLSEERIENTVVAENQLDEILSGNEQTFYDFIDGPWQNGELIMYFDPQKDTATFYTNDIQENYSWVNSYKVLSNLLYIRSRNEIINYIENEIYVRIIGLDEISVTVRDIDIQTRKKSSNEIWTSKYIRMGSDQQAESVKNLDSVLEDADLPVLSGQFVSGAGDIIEFYGSDFYMKNSDEEINGGFAVYRADINILSLKIFNDKGIVTEERTFALDYTEEKNDRTIERTLVLTPGSLSIYGFHPFDTEFYRLTQLETLELETEQ